MTRLTTEWISSIERELNSWNQKLETLTGCNLARLACRACGTDENTAAGKRAAVIPITSGEGVIGQFAESVRAILRSIGMEAFVTEQTDVSGLYEALRSDADIAIMADDDRYIAVNLHNGRVGENDLCTAMGYRQLLEEINEKRTGGSLRGEPVLLMGYGRVGHIMYELLLEKGVAITVYDNDPEKQMELAWKGIPQITDRSQIREHRLIVDLTCEGDWLDPAWLREDLIMAAPGVPLSVRAADMPALADNVIHDDLEIGTAVMAIRALQE